MKKLRECTFKVGEHIESEKGWFHEWGQQSYQADNGEIANWSIAIIEDADGDVYTIEPRYVKFLEPHNNG